MTAARTRSPMEDYLQPRSDAGECTGTTGQRCEQVRGHRTATYDVGGGKTKSESTLTCQTALLPCHQQMIDTADGRWRARQWKKGRMHVEPGPIGADTICRPAGAPTVDWGTGDLGRARCAEGGLLSARAPWRCAVLARLEDVSRPPRSSRSSRSGLSAGEAVRRAPRRRRDGGRVWCSEGG
jgi:hypothetical protein